MDGKKFTKTFLLVLIAMALTLIVTTAFASDMQLFQVDQGLMWTVVVLMSVIAGVSSEFIDFKIKAVEEFVGIAIAFGLGSLILAFAGGLFIFSLEMIVVVWIMVEVVGFILGRVGVLE